MKSKCQRGIESAKVRARHLSSSTRPKEVSSAIFKHQINQKHLNFLILSSEKTGLECKMRAVQLNSYPGHVGSDPRRRFLNSARQTPRLRRSLLALRSRRESELLAQTFPRSTQQCLNHRSRARHCLFRSCVCV